MFAKCVDDPQVLELLKKCFVRIKTTKQITAISHENRANQWTWDINLHHNKIFFDHGIQESFEVRKQICDMSTLD